MCHKRLCLRLAHVFIHRRRMRSFSAYVRTHPHSFHVTYVPRYTDDRYATRWSSTSECINCRCMNGIARLACMQTAPPSLKSLYALATVHEPRHHARKASGTYVWRIDSLQRKRIVAPTCDTVLGRGSKALLSTLMHRPSYESQTRSSLTSTRACANKHTCCRRACVHAAYTA